MGEFDLSVGILLMGLFFNTYLYGLVTYQFVSYWNAKFNDPHWIRHTVTSLFILDTAHTAVGMYAAWDMCVVNYTHPESLLFINWTIPFTAVATCIAALLAQFFLGQRVLALTKSKVLTAVIGLLSFLGAVFGIIAGIKSGIISEVSQFDPLAPFVTCWLTFQTAADLLITFSLSIVLSRSRTGFRKTDTMINRLIRGAIQTGLFVSIFALGDLFSFLFARNTNFYAFFAYPIGRIYTSTLLDTLNARTELKKMDIEMQPDTVFRFRRSDALSTVHSIQVQRDVVTDATETVDNPRADHKYRSDDLCIPTQ